MTKIDLVPHLRFSLDAAVENARSINPDLLVFSTSCYSRVGLEGWTNWLTERALESRRST
jgi:hydrogenase nickel incorporation protein HypB